MVRQVEKGAYRRGFSLAVLWDNIQLVGAIVSIIAEQDCVFSWVVGQRPWSCTGGCKQHTLSAVFQLLAATV